MNTKEMIEVMQAFEDGKDIQYSEPNKNYWMSANTPPWNWAAFNYRVKPIPKPETLEDRIKAEYSDYYVVMLGFNEYDILGFGDGSNWGHTRAQSMKRFYEYVYFVESEDDLYTSREATDSYDNNTIMPVGVLFSRGAE